MKTAYPDYTGNEDGIGERELLVVSFGTSYNDDRERTIGGIEQALEKEFGSEYAVRRGFTSGKITKLLKSRDNIVIDDVREALERAANNGVKILAVQPTHLMEGSEYHKMCTEIEKHAAAFDQVAVGKPLLSSWQDEKEVMEAVIQATAEDDDGDTAVCLMGHGTEALSNQVYTNMQELLSENGYKNYFVGTVEAEPALEDLLAQVKKGSYSRVVLRPFMIVAGDHANNDMAGDEAGSWQSAFAEAGYEVKCIVEGLGQLPAIQAVFVRHAKEAVSSLKK